MSSLLMSGLLLAQCLPGVLALEPREAWEKASSGQAPAWSAEVVVSRRDGLRYKRGRMRISSHGRSWKREMLDRGGKPRRAAIYDGVVLLSCVADRPCVRMPEHVLSPPLSLKGISGRWRGKGRALGRPAWVFDIVDGRSVGRAWLDQETGIVLKESWFSDAGTLTLKVTRLELGLEAGSPGSSEILMKSATAIAGLPAWLPRGFDFDGENESFEGGERVLHYRFSNGVDALSLFRVPSRLKPSFTRTNGTGVLQRSGSAGGWVLVAALPEAVLRRVAGSLP